jgi:uncharacterized protein YkwD
MRWPSQILSVSNVNASNTTERTRCMRNRFALVVLVLSAVMLPCCAHAQSSTPQPSPFEQRIFYLLNQERELAGLKRLEWSDHAAMAAREHARLLAKNEKLSHKFTGEPPLRQRLTAASFRFTSAAENVALADNPDDAHLALMYSPGHRENILSTEYSAVGIGVVEHSGKLYVTQDFIHLLPAYTENEFFASFVKAFNRLRETSGMKAMLVQKDRALHEAACSTQGDSAAVSAKPGFEGELLLFTLSDPDQLPPELSQRAYAPRFRKVNVGICFRPDEKYGSGNFWVVAAFAM